MQITWDIHTHLVQHSQAQVVYVPLTTLFEFVNEQNAFVSKPPTPLGIMIFFVFQNIVEGDSTH